MNLLKKIAVVAGLAFSPWWLQASDASAQMQLHLLDCGTIKVKDISLFSPGVDEGLSKTLVNSCYLIKHPKGNFLWDTGLSDQLVEQKDGVLVADGMFHLKVKRTLASQLAVLGLAASDIDYVAISHFHFDHTGNMAKFKNAKFLVQKAELTAAFSDKAKAMHFDPNDYKSIVKRQFVGVSGKYDVFADGKLILLPTYGHTPGHQSLLVNLKDTGAVVLSGDLYHFEKNMRHKRVPAINVDKAETLVSMNNIDEFLAEVDGQLWIQHDLETFKRLKKSPEFYQ